MKLFVNHEKKLTSFKSITRKDDYRLHTINCLKERQCY